MKKTTKLILLFGASMLFGAFNASAWTIYYDASTFPSSKLEENQTLSSIYVSSFSTNSVWYNSVSPWNGTISGPMNGEKTDWYGFSSSATVSGYERMISFSRNTTSSAPSKFIAFVGQKYLSSGSPQRTYTRGLINGGNGCSGQDDLLTANASTFYKVLYIDGGVYSYDTYGTTTSTSTSGTSSPSYTKGVKTLLTWANDAKVAITDFKCEVLLNQSAVFTATSSIADMTISVTVTKSDGTAASSGTDYTFDNNKLTFLKTGTYVFKATTPVTSFTVTGGTVEVAPSESYEVTVDVGSDKVTVASVGDIKWDPSLVNGGWNIDEGWISSYCSQTNPFENILSYSSDNTDLGLTVTIEPTFEKQTQPSAWSESTGMSEYVWGQMLAIEETDAIIDGYWKEPTTTPSINGTAIEGYSFPCSGTYKLTVTSSNPEVVINNATQTINVFPSLNLKYTYSYNGYDKTDYGFNINGYEVDNYSSLTMNQLFFQTTSPSYDGTSYSKPIYVYIPGVYGVDIAYRSTYYSGTTTNGGEIDLTRNANNPSFPSTTYFSLSKNGSTTPNVSQYNSNPVYSFTINYSSDVNIPTGVEDLTVDGDAAAVYYNLQGVKVANPQGGIFVKVAGGKATKVIL